MENKELIGQIRQRLEILYKMFEQLEQGGGSTSDAYTKAQTDALLSEKADKNLTYTKSETNAEIEEAIAAADYITPTSYATQSTGGTAKIWTTTDGTDLILNIATE